MSIADIKSRLSDIDTSCYSVISLVEKADLSGKDGKEKLIDAVRDRIYEITDMTSELRSDL